MDNYRTFFTALVLSWVLASPGLAQDLCVKQTQEGQNSFILGATWPENADRVCFQELSQKTEVCVDTPITLGPERILTVEGQDHEVHGCGDHLPYEWDLKMAFVALSLTEGVRWAWSAYAANEIDRSPIAPNAIVIDLRQAPKPPIMLLIQTLVDQSQALVDTAQAIKTALDSEESP